MDRKIRITQAALADFEEIVEYSWVNFPETAERFANSLLNHLDLLRRFPRIGSARPRHPGVRMMVHFPIRIYYRHSSVLSCQALQEATNLQGGQLTLE